MPSHSSRRGASASRRRRWLWTPSARLPTCTSPARRPSLSRRHHRRACFFPNEKPPTSPPSLPRRWTTSRCHSVTTPIQLQTLAPNVSQHGPLFFADTIRPRLVVVVDPQPIEYYTTSTSTPNPIRSSAIPCHCRTSPWSSTSLSPSTRLLGAFTFSHRPSVVQEQARA